PAPRARPVHRLARRRGLRQRLAIHPRDGEHASAAGVLRHGGDQPVAVPRHLVEPVVHTRTIILLPLYPAPSGAAWPRPPCTRRNGKCSPRAPHPPFPRV